MCGCGCGCDWVWVCVPVVRVCVGAWGWCGLLWVNVWVCVGGAAVGGGLYRVGVCGAVCGCLCGWVGGCECVLVSRSARQQPLGMPDGQGFVGWSTVGRPGPSHMDCSMPAAPVPTGQEPEHSS